MDKVSQTDEAIISNVQRGDKELYAQIVIRYQDKLYRYASYLTADTDLAHDAVQNSFIKAYININSFNLKKKFSSWIYRITHNEVMNLIAKNKKYVTLSDKIDFASNLNLEDDLIKKDLVANTQACLNKMPLIYKEPLTLYFLDEKSYDEIGDILKIPINTVGTRINRAKKIMQSLCQKNII